MRTAVRTWTSGRRQLRRWLVNGRNFEEAMGPPVGRPECFPTCDATGLVGRLGDDDAALLTNISVFTLTATEPSQGDRRAIATFGNSLQAATTARRTPRCRTTCLRTSGRSLKAHASAMEEYRIGGSQPFWDKHSPSVRRAVLERQRPRHRPGSGRGVPSGEIFHP